MSDSTLETLLEKAKLLEVASLALIKRTFMRQRRARSGQELWASTYEDRLKLFNQASEIEKQAASEMAPVITDKTTRRGFVAMDREVHVQLGERLTATAENLRVVERLCREDILKVFAEQEVTAGNSGFGELQ